MLKNNDERYEYIHDENNWDVLEYDIASSECHTKESDKELHGGLITGIPDIRLKRLKGTSVYKIEVLARAYWGGQGDHWITIGTKLFCKDGKLDNIYDLSDNQLVTYLREHKI